MPTRNVVLTDHQSSFIEHLVASGQYQSASEVLRDGLRLVEQRIKENIAREEALRQATLTGIADMEAGRFTEFSNPQALRDRILSTSLGRATETSLITES